LQSLYCLGHFKNAYDDDDDDDDSSIVVSVSSTQLDRPYVTQWPRALLVIAKAAASVDVTPRARTF